ncbi:MAG TPA: 6-pyruvoyl-tetrahydropterin synthase-related protein [Longimicrobiales bacterium]
MRPSRSLAIDVLVLAGVAALACLPILLYGTPKPSHDAPFHMFALKHFAAQLLDGVAYPRWFHDMNAGYGTPTFFFYPPLPYYAATLTSVLTFWTSDPWREVGVATWLAVALSGITFHAWIRGEAARAAALAAAALYMLTPYHLAVDAYIRGAYAEVWAFVWLPLVLIGVRRADRWSGVPVTALGVGLLLLTHPPTSLLFAPFAAAYTLLLAGQRRSLRTVLFAASGAVLGAGLAAAYLVPAIVLQDAVRMDVMTLGALDYTRWFLFAPPREPLKEGLTLVLTTMLALVVALEVALRRNATAGAHARFWAVCGVVAFLLMAAPSRFVWDGIAIAQRVQFPWRLGTVLTLSLAAVAGLRLTAIAWRELTDVFRYFLLPGIVLVWFLFTIRVMPPGASPAWQQRLFAGDMNPAAEYWTRGSERLWHARSTNSTLPNDAARAVVTAGVGTVNVLAWEPRRIRIVTASEDSIVVQLRQLHFPGWRAVFRSTGPALERDVAPDALALVSVTVPPGHNDVTVTLAPTQAETVGLRVSAACALLWLIAWAAVLVRRRHRSHPACTEGSPR